MQTRETTPEQNGQDANAAPVNRQAAPQEKAASAANESQDALLSRAEEKAAEMQDAFLRARADLENSRRRTQEEISRAYKYAIENFAEALVPVKDSLEMALKVEPAAANSLKEGVEMTLKQLSLAFEKNGLHEINPQPGEKLDPTQHEAISMVPAAQPARTIVNVLQKGYMIADRLLRPALVTVAAEGTT